MSRPVRVAVEGCGHGTLHSIYASVTESAKKKGWKDGVDVLLIGGDFQAVRNAHDLNSMAVPLKYRHIGDFHEYYSGARKAPYLTIFVGGNHEASNHLWELYYGGWVAPNIYYAGAANVLRLGPLRIAGLSGIWKGYDYRKPHFERVPYNQSEVRSVFHVRELDVRKLLQVRTQVDVAMSHDWPNGIEWLGDHKWLFKKKNGFEEDARSGNLGSKAARYVLDWLRPPYWFSAHLHVKYAAMVDHKAADAKAANGVGHAGPPTSNGHAAPANDAEIDLDLDEEEPAQQQSRVDVSKPVRNTDEIDLDDDIDAAPEATPAEVKEAVEDADANANKEANSAVEEEDLRAQLPEAFRRPPQEETPREPDPPTSIFNMTTNFLALDKCLANRHFLQLLEFEPVEADTADAEAERPFRLRYDAEWLAITRAFAKAEPLQVGDSAAESQRDKGRAHYARLIDEERKWVDENVVNTGKDVVPKNFELTAPAYDPSVPITTREGSQEYTNSQTVEFCNLLGIPNPLDASEEERAQRMAAGPKAEEERQGGFRGGRGGGHSGGGRGGGGRGGDRRGGRGRGRGLGRGRGR